MIVLEHIMQRHISLDTTNFIDTNMNALAFLCRACCVNVISLYDVVPNSISDLLKRTTLVEYILSVHTKCSY